MSKSPNPEQNLHSEDSETTERARIIAQIEQFESESNQLHRMQGIENLLEVPLTMQQLKTLGIISTSLEPITTQGLADLLGISPPSVSGIIDRLVEGHMVTRHPHPHDQRVRVLHATEQGNELLQRLLSQSTTLQRQVLEAMAIEDLRALNQGMSALRKILQELQ